MIKDGGPSCLILAGRQLTGRFVIDQGACRARRICSYRDRTAVDFYQVCICYADTQLGELAIHGNPAVTNPAFYLSPGTKPRTCQHLLQAFSHGSGKYREVK
jgi:hypothetical protein